jgi:hypothetical protein
MGNTYWNVTVIGTELDAVVQEFELSGLQGFVYEERGNVVVFPELTDESAPAALGATLARKLDAPALSVLVFDSDVLQISAFDSEGDMLDSYDNAPGYFDEEVNDDLPLGEDGMPLPTGGDASLLVALAGAGDAAAVERTLRRESESYTFAEDLHEELVRHLGLPLAAVRTDFGLLAAGERPAGGGEWRLVQPG